jgi:uncharacterized protein (DUF1697 family)
MCEHRFDRAPGEMGTRAAPTRVQDECMRTHVGLLRGVNVGGRNVLSMADLRGAATDAGFADVATLVQSGNVVHSAPEDELGRALLVRATAVSTMRNWSTVTRMMALLEE